MAAMMGVGEGTSDACALIPRLNDSAAAAITVGKRRQQRNLVSADELPTGILDTDKPKHSYWRYFRRDRATARAECRMCGRSIQMGLKSSTGGMRRHLQSLHFGIFVEFIAERAEHPRGAVAAAAAAATALTPHNHHHQMALRKRVKELDDGDEQQDDAGSAAFRSPQTKHFLQDIKDGYYGGGAEFDTTADSFCSGSSATLSYGGDTSGSHKRLRQHSIKTELFTPQSSSLLHGGLERSLQDSLKVLLDNHHQHNGVGDQQQQYTAAGGTVDDGLVMLHGGDAVDLLASSHRHQNTHIDHNDDDDHFHLPTTSQERLHQMVFNNDGDNATGGVRNSDIMAAATSDGVVHSAVGTTTASASSLREITDTELIGRLQIARERLKDAMDMIDSLHHELAVRQQLRERLL